MAALHGAGNVLLFGSVARGEDTPESDVDLLVDVTGDTTPWFPGSLIAEDSAPGRDAVFASRTLQDAIVRNLQVLCESTQRIGEPHKQRHPEINWPSIVGMRNILVHDYFEVDFETVWLVVTRDLPPLEKAMRAIMAVLDQPR